MEDLSHRAHQRLTTITQILNEQLQETGVTTKVAAPAKGILQILCEAGHPENLDKAFIIRCIQRSLNEIAPRYIHDVYIKSRLTNDTQCLWVANLTQEARCKLLWSEKIQIQHLSLWQKLFPKKYRSPRLRDRRIHLNYTTKVVISTMLGTIATGALGWIVYDWWQLRFHPESIPATLPAPTVTLPPSPVFNGDAFNQGIRLANQAAFDGQTARTYGQWVALANRWQQAADLMAMIPPEHTRYTEAQTRVLGYRRNSEAALAQASAIAPNSPP